MGNFLIAVGGAVVVSGVIFISSEVRRYLAQVRCAKVIAQALEKAENMRTLRDGKTVMKEVEIDGDTWTVGIQETGEEDS